jgi:hypothetical protein
MNVTSNSAWEPVTPRGVAAFAHAKWRRLLLVQFLVALLVAASVAWLLHNGFFPTVTAAIEQLPPGSEVRSARLNWRGESPQLLAEGRYLSVAVDLEHSGEVRSLANFQVEFGRANVVVHSLLGYLPVKYPEGWIIAFNHAELSPRWGAWRPVLLAEVMATVVMYLLASWSLLALIYCGPVCLIGFFANRELDWRASWRLAGAAMLPGALVMAMAILLYSMGVADLVQLGFAFAAHLVVGWIYLVVSPFFAPRLGWADGSKNPFVPGTGQK